MKREKMLIRLSDQDNLRSNGKYYVCYASDGGPVSPDTDYRYFATKKEAKLFIAKNNGQYVTE